MRGGDVQAALGLGQPGPAAGPRILTRGDRPGAGRATDRRITLGEQQVDRDAVAARVVEHLVEAPGGDRVDLHHLVGVVPLDQRRVSAQRGVLAAQAGDPRLIAGQFAVDRLDLAQPAALRRVAVVQPRAEPGVLLGHRQRGQHVDDRDVGGGRQRVAGADRLGEVVAGLQEQHVHSGTVSGRQVRHDGVRGHRAGHNQGVTERVGRPGEYLVGAAARAGRTGEACGRLPREGLQLSGRAAASRPMWCGHGARGVDFDAHRSASSSARCAQWAKDSPGSRSVANRRVMRST